MLRRRGIRVVFPDPSDQQANRKRRGAKGGRPPKLDRETYKRRNVVERSFNLLKQWRGLATRSDKHASSTAPAPPSRVRSETSGVRLGTRCVDSLAEDHSQDAGWTHDSRLNNSTAGHRASSTYEIESLALPYPRQA